MKSPRHYLKYRSITAVCVHFLCASGFSQNAPISLNVDATDAPRKILHARLQIPAPPGPLTLLYPKWLPGEHAPNGSITDLVGLKMSAAGIPVEWRRDSEDMYAFHLDVPAGADAVEVALDFLLPPSSGDFSSGASATAQLLDLSWNQVLLYPQGARAREIQYAATLRLPAGWKFGTALVPTVESFAGLEFPPVSLEALVDYLGVVLAARSGLWTNENFRENLALDAAGLDYRSGRIWRPLADTAVAAQLLYRARPEGAARRRSVDFYAEGDLIWLEADVLIRQKTNGRRSLDDFCRKFHGGNSGPPGVVAYTFDDVVATLNEIVPYDWREFFQSRVYAANPRAPLGGIEASGWRLVYRDTLPDMLKSRESAGKFTDLSFSLGLTIKEEGAITDVIAGSPADKAGIGPAMKLVAVNGRRWTPAILRAAVKSAKTGQAPIELLVENEEYFKTCKLQYHDGERYPYLERDEARPDLLSEILKPLTQPPAASTEKKQAFTVQPDGRPGFSHP